MLKLKKIGVLSAARIQSLLMAVYGVVMGLILAITLITNATELTKAGISESELQIFNQLGNWVLVIFPLIYLILFAIIGFILGAVGSFLYNLIAKRTGGIELELSK